MTFLLSSFNAADPNDSFCNDTHLKLRKRNFFKHIFLFHILSFLIGNILFRNFVFMSMVEPGLNSSFPVLTLSRFGVELHCL